MRRALHFACCAGSHRTLHARSCLRSAELSEELELMRKYKVLQITNFMDMSGQQETVLSTTAGLNTDYFEAHLAANLSGNTRRNVDTILARRARSIPHLHVHDLPYVRIMPSPYHDTHVDRSCASHAS